jgi:hypothetical protein
VKGKERWGWGWMREHFGSKAREEEKFKKPEAKQPMCRGFGPGSGFGSLIGIGTGVTMRI